MGQAPLIYFLYLLKMFKIFSVYRNFRSATKHKKIRVTAGAKKFEKLSKIITLIVKNRQSKKPLSGV